MMEKWGLHTDDVSAQLCADAMNATVAHGSRSASSWRRRQRGTPATAHSQAPSPTASTVTVVDAMRAVAAGAPQLAGFPEACMSAIGSLPLDAVWLVLFFCCWRREASEICHHGNLSYYSTATL